MKTLFDICCTHGQFYYHLFYFLAILSAGVLFIIDGKRKKYSMEAYTLIYASAIIFLIIGTKIFTYTPDQWKIIFRTFNFPFTSSNTILGGIFGGIIGIWIARKLIRFPYPVLDSFAVALPLAMAIQRIGCLLVGCCYGTPTTLPWAISYSSSSLPYFMHLKSGLIDATSIHSAPVHPNQLYQIVLCLIIAIIIWKLKNKVKTPGNLFFISVVLYLTARFFIEFWRDPVTNGIAGNTWFALKLVQWGIITGIAFMLLFIVLRARKYKVSIIIPDKLQNPLWYFIMLCLFAGISRNWFTKTEFFFIEFVLIPTTIYQLHAIFSSSSGIIKFRKIYAYTLSIILLFNGGVTAQKIYLGLFNDSTSRNVFHDISISYGYAEYSHYHMHPYWNPPYYVYEYDGCLNKVDSTYYPGKWTQREDQDKYKHYFKAIAVEYTQTRTYGKYNRLCMKGNFTYDWESDVKNIVFNKINVYDAGAFIYYQTENYGIGAGFHKGRNINNLDDIDKPLDYLKFSFSIKNGIKNDLLYLTIRINEVLPYFLCYEGRDIYQMSIGSNFGYRDVLGLECGLSNFGNFISFNTMIKNQFGLKFNYTFYSLFEKDGYKIFQMSLAYRFAKKHWNKN
ncbi:MAG: prolipoprotein diacylglyceryl transferase [Bacteroidetes bacterium]|nr:prolipoprotein diacylglyceryl transferase [Bacteroidota bacterium]